MFLTSRYLGIVMEYVTGGDLADMVDVWNVRNRKSHRARGPGEAIPHQWVLQIAPVRDAGACHGQPLDDHVVSAVFRRCVQRVMRDPCAERGATSALQPLYPPGARVTQASASAEWWKMGSVAS